MPISYVDLETIDTGEALVDLLAQKTTLDIETVRVESEAPVVILNEFEAFCANFQLQDRVGDRITQRKDAARALDSLRNADLWVAAALFERTIYEVDEDAGISMFYGESRDKCLVIRVAFFRSQLARANVDHLVDGAISIHDPAVYTDEARREQGAMFNVMVTAMDNAWEQGVYEWNKSRILEYTDKSIETRLKSLDNQALTELASLPTLFMYEQGTEGEIRIGRIKKILDRGGTDIKVIFEFDEGFPHLTADDILKLKWELGLADYQFSRTHWAVKQGDLAEILIDAGISPATKPEALPQPEVRPASVETLPAKIFLVHGRDEGKKSEVARFLEVRVGLEVVILSERPNKGRGLLTKFQDESRGATYAVVLMTADDLGYLASDTGGKMHLPRARQNVVFELGFFIGRLGADRVCALVPPGLDKPSDYDGIVYIGLDDGESWQRQLVTELHSADVPVSDKWWQAR